MQRWTRNELLLALNLYFETPFGKQHKTYPPIVALAELLGRTPSSVSMKLCNFTSLDPVEADRGISGLSGASKLDKAIWEEFHNSKAELVDEIETLIEQQESITEPNLKTKNEDLIRRDTERESVVRQRRYQNFFRRVVLSSYGSRCCITLNPIRDLLRASHIIPWSKSEEQRLNPRNGLCLAATFDVAFDRGLISLDKEFRLLLSPRLKDHTENTEIHTTFLQREGSKISLPEKNLPDPECLSWHRQNIFEA